jgi:hypothetical protein
MNNQMTIQQQLNEFYQTNNFGDEGGANETWVWFKFGPISLPFYNFKQRRELIWLHDLNHLVTGYDTNWRGESSVSAWETATGGWGISPVWILILSAFGIGLFLHPVATFKAFVRGRYTRGPVNLQLPKKQLIQYQLSDLKQELGLANEPVYKANLSDVLHFLLWAFVSLALILAPLWGGLLVFRFYS